HRARDVALSGLNETVQSLAQRSEPLAVVDELGVSQGDVLLVVKGLAVKAKRLELVVGGVEQRAGGSFVSPVGLDPHQAVFNQIGASDPVRSRDRVQLLEQLDGAELLPVH